MSTQNRTKPIGDLVEFAREFYKLGGACRVLRDVDISGPYINLHTLHVTKDGIEAQDADVIVHLEPKSNHSGTEIRYLYLWDDKIWNSDTNFDAWKDHAGIMMVNFMETVQPAS